MVIHIFSPLLKNVNNKGGDILYMITTGEIIAILMAFVVIYLNRKGK